MSSVKMSCQVSTLKKILHDFQRVFSTGGSENPFLDTNRIWQSRDPNLHVQFVLNGTYEILSTIEGDRFQRFCWNENHKIP